MELGFILATIGLGIMFGLSGVGSVIGLVIAGSSGVGALSKRPEVFGQALILTALQATQGLYGFVGFIIYSSTVTPTMNWFTVAIVLGAGLGMGLVNLISAIHMGKVCAAGISSIGMGHNAFVSTMIFAAFPELYAILGLVGGIMMNGLIK